MIHIEDARNAKKRYFNKGHSIFSVPPSPYSNVSDLQSQKILPVLGHHIQFFLKILHLFANHHLSLKKKNIFKDLIPFAIKHSSV